MPNRPSRTVAASLAFLLVALAGCQSSSPAGTSTSGTTTSTSASPTCLQGVCIASARILGDPTATGTVLRANVTLGSFQVTDEAAAWIQDGRCMGLDRTTLTLRSGPLCQHVDLSGHSAYTWNATAGPALAWNLTTGVLRPTIANATLSPGTTTLWTVVAGKGRDAGKQRSYELWNKADTRLSTFPVKERIGVPTAWNGSLVQLFRHHYTTNTTTQVGGTVTRTMVHHNATLIRQAIPGVANSTVLANLTHEADTLYAVTDGLMTGWHHNGTVDLWREADGRSTRMPLPGGWLGLQETRTLQFAVLLGPSDGVASARYVGDSDWAPPASLLPVEAPALGTLQAVASDSVSLFLVATDDAGQTVVYRVPATGAV